MKLTVFLLCVFRLDVNASDSGAKESDLDLIATCFDKNGFVLDGNDSSDDSADGGNLVTDLKIVTHILNLLLLLLGFAGSEDKKYYHNTENKYHR